MDYLFKLIVLFFLSFPVNAAGNAWVSKWVDGPASATFERTSTAMRTYVDLPQYGGHAQWTLPSTAPATGMGSYIAPASTATTAKIATNVKIPVGAAAGSAAAATLTAVIPKAALAKAAVALVRANPYVTAVITFGWLANAGYHYFADTDTFSANVKTTTSMTCPNLGVGGQLYNPASHALFIGTSNYSCPTISAPAQWDGYCINSGPSYQTCIYSQAGPPSPAILTPTLTAQGLETTPISGTADSVAGFDNVIKETTNNGFAPDTDGGTPTLSGSITPISGPVSTTTSPNGTVTNSSTTYTPTYNNNYVDMRETTTTTVTDNNNVTTTTTSTGPANTTPPPKDVQTDCDKYPDSIGCAKFGDAGAPDVVQTVNVSATLNPTSLGSGTCPAPNVVQLSQGRTVTFSYQPECDLATGIAPFMIALAWLAAGMLVLSPVRG